MAYQRVSGIGDAILAATAAMSWLEAVAVALGVVYLLLAVREDIRCWYAAFVSSAISVYLFWNVALLMESALNVYYVGMAVFGWWQWRARGPTQPLVVTRWGWQRHVVVVLLIVLLSALSGTLLQQNTEAAWPFVDSFTTWGAVITTFLVAKKVLENWLYWIVIDAVAIVLYAERGLYLYALLFIAYTVIAVVGYRQWLQTWRAANA